MLYIIIAILAFTTLLFWAKWTNKKADLKTAQENHTKSELEKAKELKRLNKVIENIETILRDTDSKFIGAVTTEVKDTLPVITRAYKVRESLAKHKEEKNNILNTLSRLRGSQMYVSNSIVDTVSKVLVELNKRGNLLDIKNRELGEKDEIIEKREKSLHVAHQVSYGYRKKLIKAGLLKPRKKKKK